MRTFELTTNFYRTIFNVTETEITSHLDMFDIHEGGNLFPQTRKVFTLEDLKWMGVNSTEQFILKTQTREPSFREITGAYADKINETYMLNKELYYSI